MHNYIIMSDKEYGCWHEGAYEERMAMRFYREVLRVRFRGRLIAVLGKWTRHAEEATAYAPGTVCQLVNRRLLWPRPAGYTIGMDTTGENRTVFPDLGL